jgi:hypothetical protein
MALGPAFATGFALQRGLEILDPAVSKVLTTAKVKKVVLNGGSFLVGLLLAVFANLRVLAPLGLYDASQASVVGLKVLDAVVSGLIISGGTEGFNSIMKFLGYSKMTAKHTSGAGSETG